VVHQLVLVAVVWSAKQPVSRLPRWVAPVAVFAFVAMCGGYYDLCRRLNLAVAWVFLTGFLACWPLAVPLAYRFPKLRGAMGHALWAILAFTLYFWASAAVLWVRAVLMN
jgi:hypothetical protein